MKKIAVGTSLILPAVDMVMGILERAEFFADQRGNEMFAEVLEGKILCGVKSQGITRNSVADLVVAMYLDQLNNYSKWTPNQGSEEYYEAQIIKMVPGWSDLPSTQQFKFFNEVLRPAYELIHDWVLTFENDCDHWHLWYARRLGLDVVIEKGQDYRIVDWERRMAAGAEHQAHQEAGETPPAHAWLPDDDAKRFVELIKQQQVGPSPLGTTFTDAIDKQRSEIKRKSNRTRRGRPG